MSDRSAEVDALIEIGRYAEAEVILRQMLSSDPDDGWSMTHLAQCRHHQGDKKEAIKIAKQAIALDPDYDWAHQVLAHVYAGQNRYDDALDQNLKAIELAPHNASYYGFRSFLLLTKRKFKLALQVAEDGLQIDPENASCLARRAEALSKLGRSSEAVLVANSALVEGLEDTNQHTSRAYVLLEQGDHKGALLGFRDALRLDPANEWAQNGLVEAVRAKWILYRWLLKAVFWINRYSLFGRRSGVLVIYLSGRLLLTMAKTNPTWKPVLYPISALLIGFYILLFFMEPIVDIVMSLSSEGRILLSKYSIVIARIVLGLAAYTGIAAIIGFGFNQIAWKAVFIFAILTILISLLSMKVETKGLRIFCGMVVGLLLSINLLITGLAVFEPGDRKTDEESRPTSVRGTSA